MTDITITLIQSDLDWENKETNLSNFQDKISQIQQTTDVIILPEMFNTGFTMDAATHAEKMDGPTMTWMAKQADGSNAVIVGSLIIEENRNYYNRLVWMYPGGMFHTYDKRHLFAMAGEHEHYTPGEGRLIIEYKGWRICPLICYDLRFPVWSRNNDEYDLLIYIANWPEKRAHDWLTLLSARAIENQTYVVGVNRVGKDKNDLTYNGDSCVIDPGWNKTMFHCEKDEVTHTITLSAPHLKEVREKLPFLVDSDDFKIV